MKQSKSQAAKILRKQRRCQTIISNETGLESSDNPTQNIAICNAGLSTGLQEEILLKEITCYGNIVNLIMLPHKSYCFLKCTDLKNSQNIFNNMHGKTKLGQSGGILYLSYFEGLPDSNYNWQDISPPGLIILKDYVSKTEENEILYLLKDPKADENSLKHRFVKHYGYEFLYGSNLVDPDKPMDLKIPSKFDMLWQRLRDKCCNLDWYEPDQLTVNVYKIGQGIPPHVDTHSAFLDPIISLSLEDDVVMEFRKSNEKCLIFLPRRSLLIMSGESRYDWTHGIRPRALDIIPSANGTLTVRQRSQRTSLTFRKLRCGPCDCQYKRLCDTKIQKQEKNKTILSSDASKLEMMNVHAVYEQIASHFSETRHSPWPKVANFINSFTTGDILLDIGCGNGKYLNISSKTVNIGCDRSEGLLSVCTKRQFNVFKCDCLSVPFRDESVDGCISIAVLHHLATKERRMQAIEEMVRVLTVKGRALIYVWAKNQSADSKKSSYLRQNKNKPEKEHKSLNVNRKFENSGNIDLPVHTNRTEFKEQDVLVPWKLKNLKENSEESEDQIYLRYYHVFEENELENLCNQINNIQIIDCYYDQGNWCIIFEKIK